MVDGTAERFPECAHMLERGVHANAWNGVHIMLNFGALCLRCQNAAPELRKCIKKLRLNALQCPVRHAHTNHVSHILFQRFFAIVGLGAGDIVQFPFGRHTRYLVSVGVVQGAVEILPGSE